MADFDTPSKRKSLLIALVCDTSGSMGSNGGMGQLNAALPEVIRALREEQGKNPLVDFYLTVEAFNSSVTFPVNYAPIGEASCPTMQADGATYMGLAMTRLGEHMKEKLGTYNAKPLLVLLSDGVPTDNFQELLSQFDNTDWGKRGRTTRYAVALGQDSDTTALAAFTGSLETVLKAGLNVPGSLAAALTTATVTGSRASSQVAGSGSALVAPTLPPVIGVATAADPTDAGDDGGVF